MKTHKVKEVADKKLRHVDVDFPMSMRSKGEEHMDGSNKKEIEVGSRKKTAKAKKHAVAKICAAAKQ